jgi:hypothetical protein
MPTPTNVGSDRERPARPDRYDLCMIRSTGKFIFGEWMWERTVVRTNIEWDREKLALSKKYHILIASNRKFIYIGSD